MGIEHEEVQKAVNTKNVSVAALIAALILPVSAENVAAEEAFDFGEFEYRSHCASCHGPTGKGDGPMGQYLVSKPSDLTVLSKNNGGVFPVQQVYEVIDGQKEVGAHGTRTMPVWGREFRSTVPNIEALGLADFGPQIAHARIASVVDYLHRIQEQ
jgi:mono/diheme cytochrome c family protein